MAQRGAAKQPLTPLELRDIVRGYVIGRIRAVVAGHDALFTRSLALYSLVEEEMHAEGGDAGERIRALKAHPLYRTVHALIHGRARHVLDASLRLMEDNRRIMARLESRVVAEAIDTREQATRAYREVLVAEVPLERSLDNVEAIAQSCELLWRLLRSRNFVARALTREAYAFARRVVVRSDPVRAEMDRLWLMLRDDPAQLQKLAEAIRKHGSEVVREVYATSQQSTVKS